MVTLTYSVVILIIFVLSCLVSIFPVRVEALKGRDHHVPRAYDTAELKEKFVNRLKEPRSNMEHVDNIIMNLHCVGVCLSLKPKTTLQFQ